MAKKNKEVGPIGNAEEFTDALSDAIVSFQKGEIDYSMVKGISLLGNTLNKHNLNQLEYMKITKKDTIIEFFEE